MPVHLHLPQARHKQDNERWKSGLKDPVGFKWKWVGEGKEAIGAGGGLKAEGEDAQLSFPDLWMIPSVSPSVTPYVLKHTHSTLIVNMFPQTAAASIFLFC